MSEGKYRALFDLAADSLMILDMEGVISDINLTGHERLGYFDFCWLYFSQCAGECFKKLV